MTSGELPKHYDPGAVEPGIYARWSEAEAFAAVPDERDDTYVVMMPLPNVTGALHMGHAMDNVMQDLLVRWHRMQGDNTLWMPGTDHAGIATQAVVEKRLKELEGLTRHDLGREGLVERIYAWKDEYQQRIVHQQQQMGCSCDWGRQRFTMDPVCSAAVREAFFRLFRDKLIYRGMRLVNWDCHIQTAVSDDEVYHEAVQGHFWHLRYPVIDPAEGEPDHVVVATTRPETMLGDTAVAVHPDPERALADQLAAARERAAQAGDKDRKAAAAEVKRLEERQASHLPRLLQLTAMAKAGRRLRLPLLDREIPLILDTWAKPELGSGCVKITPAHDPNDYEVWQRHKEEIGIVNLLEPDEQEQAPDGTYNRHAGPYAGLDRFEVRRRVVADLEAQGLLERTEEREVDIGHSDRSKTPIEPYHSRQWFVRMSDVEGGVLCGRGTAKEFRTPGLAQAAIDATLGPWKSPTGLKLDFHPDPERYRGTYVSWLAEKRDWCISRQLWWGHRIPVWSASFDDAADLRAAIDALPEGAHEVLHAWVGNAEGKQFPPQEGLELAQIRPQQGPYALYVCLRHEAADAAHAGALEALGLERDADVLDTWFSSALWPFSTLGWPDPVAASDLVEAGQARLEGVHGQQDCLRYYFPGSCLVTGRDIITLWVARMVIMGLYNLGDLPFTDTFLHAKILDGKGQTMSKSKGNGVDPVDIIGRYGADAMRYVICDLQTGMQDIRLPVQTDCPACEAKEIELAEAKHGRNEDGTVRIFSYLCPECGAEFDVLGSMEGTLPQSKIYSKRFEVGKNFCNKLWNAARFALMNLGEHEFRPLGPDDLAPEDRWILARLARAVGEVHRQLELYNPSAALGAARELFWGELCDWYLELIKPRLRDEARAPAARQVLSYALDQVLRLLHPFVPFVTEALWARLNAQVPRRGIAAAVPPAELLIVARWPEREAEWEDDALEGEFDRLREVIRGLRDLRQKYNVPPKRRLPGAVKASGPALAGLQSLRDHVVSMAGLESLDLGDDVARPANAAVQVVGEVEAFLGDVLDPEKERARLEKQRKKLEGQIGGSEKKLGNDKFVENAPADVVDAERRRLDDLKAQLARLDAEVRQLG